MPHTIAPEMPISGCHEWLHQALTLDAPSYSLRRYSTCYGGGHDKCTAHEQNFTSNFSELQHHNNNADGNLLATG
jgi:hypothetical protein